MIVPVATNTWCSMKHYFDENLLSSLSDAQMLYSKKLTVLLNNNELDILPNPSVITDRGLLMLQSARAAVS